MAFLVEFAVFTMAISPGLSTNLWSEPDYNTIGNYLITDGATHGMRCDTEACISGQKPGKKWNSPCKVAGDWRVFQCIPFSVDTSLAGNTQELYRAMNWFREKTCIAWVFRENQTNYVNVTDSTGCWSSHLGMAANGPQTVELGPGCWNWPTVVFHELMHALGFEHLHQRNDRDKYIEIINKNIDPNAMSNFNVRNGIDKMTGQFWDFDSVMMYGSMDFQKAEVKGCNSSECYTVKRKGPGLGYIDTVSGRSHPSAGDIDLINRYYGCDKNLNAKLSPAIIGVPNELSPERATDEQPISGTQAYQISPTITEKPVMTTNKP